MWFGLLLLGMAGLWWLAYRLEPHMVSRNGTRMLCSTQDLTDLASPGRLRETRLTMLPDGEVLVSRKQGLRRTDSIWRVEGRAPDQKKLVVFLLGRTNGDGRRERLAVRVPATSRAVGILSALEPRGTAGSAAPPDRG